MLGYYRSPTICRDTIVFVCEDDLWIVPVEGGEAKRLTSNRGTVSSPCLSPDGTWIAFIGQDEGPFEVYLMPAFGGEAERLTYQGSFYFSTSVAGWDGEHILYSNRIGSALDNWLWKVSAEGGEPQRLPYGPAKYIDFSDTGGVILGRSWEEPAFWKRYRGGQAGQLWIDPKGDGQFQPLKPVDSNFTTPMWIGERIYFASDHEGIGNIYSCLPTGEDMRRHTHQDTYYCRSAQTDGIRIVYQAGGDLFVYDIEKDTENLVDVDFRGPRTQRQRKFVEGSVDYTLTPNGDALALTCRGKLFTMANWGGAVLQHGERDGTRYRLTQWLNDGERLITISDTGGEEALEIHTRDGSADIVRLNELDIGYVRDLRVPPQTISTENDSVLLVNTRMELLHIDLETRELRILDKGHYDIIRGVAWSPDGEWCAYSFPSTATTSAIKLCKIETGETWLATEPEFCDFAPAWDPDGKYLYFLSNREFVPISDDIHFDFTFIYPTRPMLITLQADLGNPFFRDPHVLEEEKVGELITIDLEGISQRVAAFPCESAEYTQIAGIEGKVIFTSNQNKTDAADYALHVYDLKAQEKDILIDDISYFELSRDAKMLVYQDSDHDVRVIEAGKDASEYYDEDHSDPFRPSPQTGWINLSRVKVSVVPPAEWHQMYREAWRLQRDFFWTEDMSGVDWEQVYQRYLPLLDRVATRGELADLIQEMQGELGTSHAYESGGDYERPPDYAQGSLGADFVYDAKSKGYRITHIPRGDGWDVSKDSPLNALGGNIRKGDILLAIGGQRVSKTVSLGELLVNLAAEEVQATFQDASTGEKWGATLNVLDDMGEEELRYREWVSQNRRYVREKTEGKVGYIHIPDMNENGYGEFYRGFLAEMSYPGLLIDVRYNRGGYVAELLLEKLAPRRIGYAMERWGKISPYPEKSVLGPMVVISNECTASDGDMFSHCFKLMELGLLIGKRTWGGVVGTLPHSLVDGGETTQPRASHWFVDVGWGLENHGTDPDIEVDYPPQNYMTGSDPQLDRAIEELLRQIERHPPEVPDFSERPLLTLPTLPKV